MVYLVLAFLPAAAAAILLGLALADLRFESFGFWPPPSKSSWQNRLFIALFRVVVYGAVGLSLHDIWRVPPQIAMPPTDARLWIGAALLLAGFAGGFAATFGLGWRTAFGAKQGLQTRGIFRLSRNPIYIATWFGLAGWAVLLPAPALIAALAIWGLLYVPAIFLEERWLRRQYGAAFAAYCAATPRFVRWARRPAL